MLKIKVNLDKKSYDILISDINLFRIIKSNSTINKNKFMNLLFENYYDEYQKEFENISNKIKDILSKNNIDNDYISNDIAMNLNDYKYPSLSLYYDNSLTFYLNDDNEFKLESLDILSNMSLSSYFRRLIHRYLELPQYKREEIIFKKTVDKINNAIKSNKKIKIKLDDRIYTLKPYIVGTSKEEIYSYLLGLDNDNPISIHIYKIRSIVILDSFEFTDDEIALLNNINILGIQYPFKNKCIAKIKLDNEGKRLFNVKYLNRPTPTKIEGDYYYFECSFIQLQVYFMGFGDNMVIKYPKSLAKSIYDSYKGYVDNYEHTQKRQ